MTREEFISSLKPKPPRGAAWFKRIRQTLHSVGHAQQELVRVIFPCAILAFAAACSSHIGTKRTAGLPDVFASPGEAPDFSLPSKPASIEKRILSSECGDTSPDISGLGSGLMTRPARSDGLYLDKGRADDGTKWFLVRAKDDPDITYCGIAIAGGDEGTNVSVTNVRRTDMDLAKAAIESGDFLCRCKQLAK